MALVIRLVAVLLCGVACGRGIADGPTDAAADPVVAIPERPGGDAGFFERVAIVVAGPLEGTLGGAAPQLEHTLFDGVSFLSIAGRDPRLAVELRFHYTGKPPAGRAFDETSPGFSCQLSVVDNGDPGGSWIARTAARDESARGRCAITLDSVEYLWTGHGAEGYRVSGTVRGTLEPGVGTPGGPLALAARF